MLAKCGADGMEIEQCDVDTAFLYGKLEEEIYMELPEGLRELLELAEAKGEDDVVCMLLHSLYGLKQASRVWNETIDKHLKSMGFKPADADPCVYTRGEGEEECIVCLSLRGRHADRSKTENCDRVRIDYDMERRTWDDATDIGERDDAHDVWCSCGVASNIPENRCAKFHRGRV
ncbi:unnamed protein product [Phytophthora fragariaefolia]|uniref:Unnamed protein product n=1 Tax=Phytophthora fragariaefolia TaxID=1490495 RepID=A0A9W6XA44_9STRA|nr:unnamed protein product [Phytophthora fragariaefolia]